MSAERFDFIAHLWHQKRWSERTFGPGDRTAGIVDHIRKELIEVEGAETPLETLEEFVDVIILALDGAWRLGYMPETLVEAIQAKQRKNEGRKWPDWRAAEPGKAMEHIEVES